MEGGRNGPRDHMSRDLTASSLERAMACPASAFLPQTNSTSVHAERGNVVDDFVRAVLTGTPKAAALAAIDDKATRSTCERIDFGRLGGDLHDVRCQVAYVLDPVARTAREVGVNIGRDYARYQKAPGELAGTDDLEGASFTGTPVILDVKSGYQPVTPCAENAQMAFYCAAKALVTGATYVEGRIARIRPSGEVALDCHTFTRFDLDVFLDDVEEALERIARERTVYLIAGEHSVSTGDWCRHCHAMSHCQEYVTLARTMVADLTDIEARVGELTLAQAGAAWHKASQAEALLKRIFAALEARARQEPLPSSYGKVVREISYETQRFSQEKALALLEEKGASPEEVAGLYGTNVVRSVRETSDPNTPKRARATKKRKEVA